MEVAIIIIIGNWGFFLVREISLVEKLHMLKKLFSWKLKTKENKRALWTWFVIQVVGEKGKFVEWIERLTKEITF